MKIAILIFISIFIFIGCQAPIRKNEYIGGYSDPCLNKTLLQLERKEKLTNEEMQTYIQLKTLCENSKASKERTDVFDSMSGTIKTYVTFNILLTVGLIVYLVAQ